MALLLIILRLRIHKRNWINCKEKFEKKEEFWIKKNKESSKKYYIF